MSLDKQIKKTKAILIAFDTYADDEVSLENQIIIMETLQEIQNDLRRVKKEYPIGGPV